VSARRRLPAGILVAALALATTTVAVSPLAPPPSPDERQRLSQGEVVYRVGAPSRDGTAVAGARGAVAFVRVPTGPGSIWAILTEPARYPEIFPGLRTVEVLESSERAWLIKTDGKFGPFSFRYFTRYRLEPDTRTMTWRLDTTRDNDVFDDNWGWWQLVPENDQTLVVYAIGSVASSWQPLAGYFERRGITQALTALRDAAVRRERAGQPG
jgi:ribosome-associated toxin RatA of RatAB toxin-antitoxin module